MCEFFYPLNIELITTSNLYKTLIISMKSLNMEYTFSYHIIIGVIWTDEEFDFLTGTV